MRRRSVWTLIFALGVASAEAGQVYKIDLLPGGYVQPRSINDTGMVAGSISTAAGYQTYVYDHGEYNVLGNPSGKPSFGYALNNSGTIAGSALDINYRDHAAIWSNGIFRDVDGRPNNTSGLYAINDHGIAVGSEVVDVPYPDGSIRGEGRLARWNGTFFENLGAPGANAEGMAINEAGVIVGRSTRYDDPNGFWHPMKWENGTFSEFSFVGDSAQAVDINESGWVLGKVRRYPRYQGILWSPTGQATLLALVDFDDNAEPYAFNDTGTVVGYFNHTHDPFSSGPAQAAIWDTTGIHDLNDFLPKGSGWALSFATDINNKGQIIGTGIYNGRSAGFLMTPVPEPSTLVVMISAAGVLYRRRRASPNIGAVLKTKN